MEEMKSSSLTTKDILSRIDLSKFNTEIDVNAFNATCTYAKQAIAMIKHQDVNFSQDVLKKVEDTINAADEEYHKWIEENPGVEADVEVIRELFDKHNKVSLYGKYKWITSVKRAKEVAEDVAASLFMAAKEIDEFNKALDDNDIQKYHQCEKSNEFLNKYPEELLTEINGAAITINDVINNLNSKLLNYYGHENDHPKSSDELDIALNLSESIRKNVVDITFRHIDVLMEYVGAIALLNDEIVSNSKKRYFLGNSSKESLNIADMSMSLHVVKKKIFLRLDYYIRALENISEEIDKERLSRIKKSSAEARAMLKHTLHKIYDTVYAPIKVKIKECENDN